MASPGGDGFVQTAPDGGGKSVDMEVVSTAAGATIYRQRAVLVGDTGNILSDLLAANKAQLAVLRALLATIQGSYPESRAESDYIDPPFSESN